MAKAGGGKPTGAIARRVKARREELGLSQRAISQPGTTYAYISRIESDSRVPSIEALIQLADALQTTALMLLTGREGRCPMCKRTG